MCSHVTRLCIDVQMPRKHVLFSEGDDFKGFFFIHEGTILLTRHSKGPGPASVLASVTGEYSQQATSKQVGKLQRQRRHVQCIASMGPGEVLGLDAQSGTRYKPLDLPMLLFMKHD
eukprot:jgi/Botrbrau1/21943/Bobra.0249s0066.1